MSDAAKAVFLSYASQDAEAAKRIADALRSAGVEVWFDQSELVGGDAWDAKIRKQIASCALFVPVISASTQTRLEGYFRIEWKVAAQRTHAMADVKPFLLPVVIDDTRDAEAHVPEEFRVVQWSRLAGDGSLAAFAGRARALLAGEGPRERRPSASVSPERSMPRWTVALTLLALGIAAGVFLLRRPTAAPATDQTLVEKAAPAVAAGPRSIAVLPFTNMSDDKDNAFFADGVHEDLLTNLANLRALKVISRTSMLRYRDTKKSTGEIGRELGVAYILEGSVRRAGNTVRVTGQLIKAATDEHVWARTYDRDLRDIFAVQTELAQEIARALHTVLSPAEAADLAARPTKSIEAYDCFQKARVLGRSLADMHDVNDKIVPLLERAVALDPGYAAAWAELTQQYLSLYGSMDRTPKRLAQARDALAHAEGLAPDAYPVLVAGLGFGSSTGDGTIMDDRHRRIIELFSQRPESLLLKASDDMGQARWPEAQANFQAALRLDPLNPEALEAYFIMLDSMRRWDEAEVVAKTLAEVQPDNLEARLLAASMVFRRSGSTAQLTRLLAELPRSAETSTSNIVVRSRIAYLTGDWPGIVALWREAGPRFRSGGFDDSSWRFMVAGAFLRLGDPASARPLLERNCEEFTRQLAADPESPMLLTECGLARAMLGEREAARTLIDQAGKIMVKRGYKPPRTFTVRWEYALVRSWVDDDKKAVIAEIGRMLREPSRRLPLANVHVLRVSWACMPLSGDPEFEAMLNDPRNNAPLF